MFNIVLVAPEIPPNTGNVIRLCANTGCTLHLVEPIGFQLTDARLRRAGLDYREGVEIKIYRDYSDLIQSAPERRALIFSKRYRTPYTDIGYHPDDWLVFGSETAGLSEEIHASAQPDRKLTLPMLPDNRSLNLSNAVAIVVYEAWRQHGFVNSTIAAQTD